MPLLVNVKAKLDDNIALIILTARHFLSFRQNKMWFGWKGYYNISRASSLWNNTGIHFCDSFELYLPSCHVNLWRNVFYCPPPQPQHTQTNKQISGEWREKKKREKKNRFFIIFYCVGCCLWVSIAYGVAFELSHHSPYSLQPLNATPPAQQCRRKRWSGNTNKISGEFCLDQARPSLLGDKDRTQLPHRGNQAHRDIMVSSPPSCPKNHILKHRRHSQAPFFISYFSF